MPLHIALALALFALVAGGGVAWWFFAGDLADYAAQVDDAETATDAAIVAAERWRARAVDAERSLELVLAEGDRAPLTAPIRVVVTGGVS